MQKTFTQRVRNSIEHVGRKSLTRRKAHVPLLRKKCWLIGHIWNRTAVKSESSTMTEEKASVTFSFDDVHREAMH